MAGLWSTDRDSFYAIGTWVRHRGHRPRPRYGFSWRSYGRLVVVARPKTAYGHASSRLGGGRGGTVDHCPDRLYLIWREGRPVGAFAHWLCGGLTDQFVLESKPSFRICPMCLARGMNQLGMLARVTGDAEPGVR